MILVLLGTQQNDFSRLLKAVDKAIEKGKIDEEVIVQAGSTKYKSDKMKQFSLIPKDEIEQLKKQAKVIAVPRMAEYGEHVNNHQIEIVESFAKKGYIIKVTDLDKFEEALEQIKKFQPKEYISNTDKMIKIIADYIEHN